MSIEFQNLNAVEFKPGDDLSGLLCLRLAAPLDVESLYISINGRVQTDIFGSASNPDACAFQGQVSLFSERVNLVKEFTHLDKTCSWHFELTIPDRCSSRAPQKHRSWNQFDSNPHQIVPPSFASACSQGKALNTANAAIIYELKACMICKDRQLQIAEPLNIGSTRIREHPNLGQVSASVEIALESARLLTNIESKERQLSRRVKAKLGSKILPFASFRLVLEGPRQAIIGKKHPLRLSVVHEDETASLPAPPTVHLKKITMLLQAHTGIRTFGGTCFKKDGCFLIHKGDEYEDWDEDLHISSHDFTKAERTKSNPITKMIKPSGLEIYSNGAQSLDLGCYTSIPAYFVPSFRTFNISRNYTLRIAVSIECAAKTFKHEFVTRNFVLLAREYVPAPSNPFADPTDFGETLHHKLHNELRRSNSPMPPNGKVMESQAELTSSEGDSKQHYVVWQ